MNRRRLLLNLAAVAAGARALPLSAQSSFFSRRAKKPAAPQQAFVYIGTDTAKGIAKGIYASRFDPATGKLSEPVLATPSLRPAYFAFGPVKNGQRILYVGSEGDSTTSAITSYAVDPVSGMLRKIGKVPSGADGPCYVSVDLTGHAVYVAEYTGSAVTSYKILPDGTLSPAVQVLDYKDSARFGAPGPQHNRQDASHPHSAHISPDNRFVVVNDLGTDQISIFPLHPETATLGEPTFFRLHPGSGPRHVAFHPNGRWLYGIDELANRIDQYLWTATHGAGTAGAQALLIDTDHSISTLAPDYKGPINTAAEVAISENGYFLYASNRGEDSLVVFAIDQSSGVLSLVQRISCGGKGPRQFTLDPSGRWLLCGNQNSASVTVFARDAGSGRLTGPVQTLPIDSPMFTLFG